MKALATLMTGAVPVARWGDDDLKQGSSFRPWPRASCS